MLNWSKRKPYPQEFYEQQTVVVARELLGSYMVYDSPDGLLVARVVETEAYTGPDDPACHSARGKKQGNAVMFGPAGRVYVYLIYGMYYCFNITTDSLTTPAAVLLRALEPLEGIGVMARRRGTDDLRNLCSGPGKLCQALGINKDFNGLSVVTGPIRFYPPDQGAEDRAVMVGPRVGISRAADWPLRFYLEGNPFVSRVPRRYAGKRLT
ncbi:MAG: DNA-3-methyladenine glycosylase [Clostridia bacterium]|nr:DNA-3-methyladenine glycosylase [Clostridia bacterium]